MPPLLFHFSTELNLDDFRMPEFDSLCQLFNVKDVTHDASPGDPYPFVLVNNMSEDVAKQFAAREIMLKYVVINTFFKFLYIFINRKIIDVWADAETFEDAYKMLREMDPEKFNKYIVCYLSILFINI